MEIKGKVHFIAEVKTISDKFRNRELVIETSESYPQFIPIQAVNDRVSLYNGLSVGDSISVSVNVRGRKWVSPQGDTKYFISLEAWRIEVTSATQPLSNPITDAPAPSYEQQVAPGTKYPNTLPEGYVSPVANTVANDPLPF